MAMSWKDWLTGCSFALTAGVIAGTLHGALGQPAPPTTAPGSSRVVLPAPEDNSQLSRTKVGSAQTARQAGSGGGARPGQGQPAPAGQPANPATAPAGKAPPKTRLAGGAPARSQASGPPATPSSTPSASPSATDPGPPPGPGASDPPTPTQPPPPTGSGPPTNPGQPTASTA